MTSLYYSPELLKITENYYEAALRFNDMCFNVSKKFTELTFSL